jgi:hypothetical protein
MLSKPHILIINFDFPANQGIGGRRWAKLAKQLAQEDYIVQVIKADEVQGNAKSTWADDVVHPHIHVHSLPRTYPHILSHPKGDLLSKIQYKLAKRKIEKSEAGTIYDISIGWNKVMTPCAESLIDQHAIVNVIATGAPWNVLTYAAALKEKFPNINLIIDYRDPWMNARNYGMQGLSAARKVAEEKKQAYALQHANVVLSPYEYLTQELKNFAEERNLKGALFNVLTHFYDPQDIPVQHPIENGNEAVIVYGGDLYFEMDEQLNQLRNQLMYLKNTRSDLYARVEVKIYTSNPNYEKFKALEVVKMHKSIGKKIFEELARADFALIMLSPSKRNDRTTKFFEYLPLRKPLLVISDEGVVTQFVRENNLGVALSKEDNALGKVLDNYFRGEMKMNADFDLSPYTLKGAAQQLISYFK